MFIICLWRKSMCQNLESDRRASFVAVKNIAIHLMRLAMCRMDIMIDILKKSKEALDYLYMIIFDCV